MSKPDAQTGGFWSFKLDERAILMKGLQDTFDVMFKELFNPVNDDNSDGKKIL